ncbi:hypothetical protein [Thioalkalivibrio sp. HK1]|uniref:hypothetical protein n=1 Tax=Thioalkalivibrio sp. HK1 TaxID=1469245 RepID=UPI000470674E|nr:hypothetical protein [Thioalkalivibrio sp. HK1]
MKKSISATRSVFALCLFLPISIALVACGPAATDRRTIVAEKGAQVMPFDLERTTHIFEKLKGGGLQQVVSDDGDDAQVRLIREHLSKESMRFSAGDFHSPAMIHGEDMAGLHELMTGADRLTIVYGEIDGGAQILYLAHTPDLIEAVHAWFDQQVSDHGSHAHTRSHTHSKSH